VGVDRVLDHLIVDETDCVCDHLEWDEGLAILAVLLSDLQHLEDRSSQGERGLSLVEPEQLSLELYLMRAIVHVDGVIALAVEEWLVQVVDNDIPTNANLLQHADGDLVSVCHVVLVVEDLHEQTVEPLGWVVQKTSDLHIGVVGTKLLVLRVLDLLHPDLCLLLVQGERSGVLDDLHDELGIDACILKIPNTDVINVVCHHDLTQDAHQSLSCVISDDDIGVQDDATDLGARTLALALALETNPRHTIITPVNQVVGCLKHLLKELDVERQASCEVVDRDEDLHIWHLILDEVEHLRDGWIGALVLDLLARQNKRHLIRLQLDVTSLVGVEDLEELARAVASLASALVSLARTRARALDVPLAKALDVALARALGKLQGLGEGETNEGVRHTGVHRLGARSVDAESHCGSSPRVLCVFVLKSRDAFACSPKDYGDSIIILRYIKKNFFNFI